MLETISLDYTQSNIILGIINKKTKQYIKLIKPGESYSFPEGYNLHEVDFISITVPPQIIHESNPDIIIQTKECPKCGKDMFKSSVCCSEKAAGFAYKYTCSNCSKIIYKKNKKKVASSI